MAAKANFRFEGEEEARDAFMANVSLRYLRLESFEKWADGTQYADRQDWWDDSHNVPLWERRPCVVYPVVDIAARSNVDLCLGEGRFPSFTSKQSEDESEEDGGLNEDQSAVLDRFIREYHKACKFKAHTRDSFYSAQACGSVCAIHGVRKSRPFVDKVPAKWCNPKFDAEGNVIELEIKYPYIEEYKNPNNGKWSKRAKLYKRVITDKEDIEYHPADANKTGAEPVWRKNEDRSVKHGLGFCPVIWYAMMKGSTTVNVIDGKPIHSNLTDEIQAHDIARSQWHRGALFSEPQICEIGVEPGYNPTGAGRTAVIPSSKDGGPLGAPTTVVTGSYGGGKSSPARKKGPGWVYQYPKGVEIELIFYPEEALKAQENNCRDLRIKLQESLAVVFLDPENIKFAATTSGKALIAIKQKQLDRCDQYRDDLIDGFFDPSIQMQLRIAHTLLSKGFTLRVPGAAKVKPILASLIGNDNSGEFWIGTPVSVEYGPYFKPDPEEEAKIVGMVQQALGATKQGGEKLITLNDAVKRIKKIFGIENVKVLVETLEKEKVEREQKALEIAQKTNQPTETPASTPAAA